MDIQSMFLTSILIEKLDKKRIEEKADELGESVWTLLNWLIEEHLDEL